MAVFQRVSEGGSTTTTTSALGTAYVPVSDVPLYCYRWTLINHQGVSFTVKRGLSDTGVRISPGTQFTWRGVGNLQDMYIKRWDNNVTQIVAEGKWEDY
jgi:hypothetical protein